MLVQKGFTLLELSIGLIIIGLIAGGVIGGTVLLRNSQLNSVISEYKYYNAATLTFLNKYESLPGDMPNATDYWGAESADYVACSNLGYGSPSTSKRTCNGNGNGAIGQTNNSVTADDEYFERFRYWQHLANAEMIKGSFSGVPGPHVHGTQVITGFNTPASRLDGATWAPWSVIDFDDVDPPTQANHYSTVGGNYLLFGAENGSTMNGVPVLYAEELKAIDDKIDDGMPATGNVYAPNNNRLPECTLTNDIDSGYNLASNTKGCYASMKLY